MNIHAMCRYHGLIFGILGALYQVPRCNRCKPATPPKENSDAA